MTVAVSGLRPDSCFVYLDDFIVHGRSLEQHNLNLVKVMERLRQVNLKLNPTKCEFLKRSILYLGHSISEQGVLPDPGKIEAIKKWPVPTSTEEVVRFVAFANYYRRFIDNFAGIAIPLHKLSRKGITFTWSDECEKAFRVLREKLSNPPLLQFPKFDSDSQFNLRTDASKIAIGAVLSNENDLPIAFASRPLIKAELNYPIIELELLAIVWAVQHYRPYLLGKRFTILTDHRPLVYLFGMTDPSSRLTKFRLKLEEFDFVIKYVKGSENVTADALSRIIISSDELKSLRTEVNVLTRAQAKRKSEGIDQPDVIDVLRKPRDATELLPIWDKTLTEDLVYNKEKNVIQLSANFGDECVLATTLNKLAMLIAREKIEKIAIIMEREEKYTKLLKALKATQMRVTLLIIEGKIKVGKVTTQQLILNEHHMSPTSGHFGKTKMFETIRSKYYWPTIRKDIDKFVDACEKCKFNKHGRKTRQPLVITTNAKEPFELIELDLVGPLPRDKFDNKYILSIHCKFSRSIVAVGIKDKSAETVVEAFLHSFVLKLGLPLGVVTDRGTEFTAELFNEMCKALGMTKIQSTAFHHESLGLTEVSHKHLGSFIRIYAEKGMSEWSRLIDYWSFGYNSSVHVDMKYSPYELVFGRQCRRPTAREDEEIGPKNKRRYTNDDYAEYVNKWTSRMKIAYEDVTNMDRIAKEKRKLLGDKNKHCINYEVGDRILVRKNFEVKHKPLFEGPFEIVGVNDPNLFIQKGNYVDEVHINRTIPFT